ncbi:MAG: hypothetical protein OXC31_15450 [Spirochaetaceae bacterium]|nr:hypothetical protein [Spirochaetaceae bacterium]
MPQTEFRNAVRTALNKHDNHRAIIKALSHTEITYQPNGVWVDPAAPGFTRTTTRITDEELVRAYLLLRLTATYGYKASPEILEVERVYKPVGRPTGKGGRPISSSGTPKTIHASCLSNARHRRLSITISAILMDSYFA